MSQTALDELLNTLPPRGAFKPKAQICEQADTLTMYFEDEPSFAHRVDGLLTVYQSFDQKKLVGFELKGVLGLMARTASTRSKVRVHADKSEVSVELILEKARESVSERLSPYDGLIRRARSVGARVPVRVHGISEREEDECYR